MNIKQHVLFAFILRLMLVVWGYCQDAFLEVRYTDIDYHVFTDAAECITLGSSPFKRKTYRYTPILALLLIPNVILHDSFGKVLFCVLDILTSLLIYRVAIQVRFSLSVSKVCACLWLYNPLTMVISSRGNAESIMTFLIILTIYLKEAKKPYLLGCIYGLSIHFKIYPSIYILSIYFSLSSVASKTKCKKIWDLIQVNQNKLIFLASTLLGFLIPTLMSMAVYEEYLEEALLYHLKRKDIRHNFSALFYLLYLSESIETSCMSLLLSFIGFIFQTLLVAVVSFTFLNFLPAAMLLETIIFVAFNKVCTSQYFLWYLCLMPLNYPLVKNNLSSFSFSVLAWVVGQSFWLLFAYFLEFKGHNTFLEICLCSLFFFFSNIHLIGMFMKRSKYFVLNCKSVGYDTKKRSYVVYGKQHDL